MVFFDDFESDQGWVPDPFGSDTATTGMWRRADPQRTSWGGALQLGSTVSGSNDLVTGPLAGSSVGSHDIDSGVTSIRSPVIALPSGGGVELSFSYYLAHLSNSSAADFLRVQVIGENASQVVFEERGSADVDYADWAEFTGELDAFAGQTVYLLIEAADAGSPSLVEAAIDDVEIAGSGGPPATGTPTALPPSPTATPTPSLGVVFSDDFETDLGWQRDPAGTDTATTGLWQRDDPQATSYSGPMQLGTTVSGVRDLVTGPLAGSSVGSDDIDSGVTSVRSPDIVLPASGEFQLRFSYYLAHLANASAEDYLRVQVVGDSGSAVLFEEHGSADVDSGAWALFTGSLSGFSGQTVHLLIEAADGGGPSLVEAGVDDVVIQAVEAP